MSGPTAKKQRTTPQYELLYWPTIPGRGEFIRLAFEATGTVYKDITNEKKDGIQDMLQAMNAENVGDSDGNPSPFAPPMLRVPGGRKDGKTLLIHQTPAILAYLSKDIGLIPEDDPGAEAQVAEITLTALDLNNEAHDTHHPIDSSKYYEEQKEESLKKATVFRQIRIPKYFSYFERALEANTVGKGKYFIGDTLTYADTSVWQVIDGLQFAFPKELEARKSDYPLLLGTFFESVKEQKGIKEYLASERRLPYSQGIFRHYAELDRQ